MGDDFDFLADLDAGAVEKMAASGGLIPEGRYYARLTGASSKIARSGTSGVELEFVVLGGPQQGVEVKDVIYVTEKSRDRFAHWSHKLGLLEKKQVGNATRYAKKDGKTDLGDCLGNEVVIEVVHESWKSETTGKTGKNAKLSYWGVWDVADKDGAAVLSKLGLKPAKPAVAAAASVAKKGPTAAAGKVVDDDV